MVKRNITIYKYFNCNVYKNYAVRYVFFVFFYLFCKKKNKIDCTYEEP